MAVMMTRESPRIRRLRSDYQALDRLRQESRILEFEIQTPTNDPPHAYLIRFLGRGLWRPSGSSDVQARDIHEVAIRLGANYPRMMPELTWRTPIFHPNISTSGVVCLGGYGTFWAPSLHLDELCNMLWDMIRYENYDVNSPYNREAAYWAKMQKDFHLPIDPRPLRGVNGESTFRKSIPTPVRVVQPDIQFLSDVVEAEVVDESDSTATREILIIE